MQMTTAPSLSRAEHKLKDHFRDHQVQDLIASSRTFPVTARVDVQIALEKIFFNVPRHATVRAA